MSRIITAEFIEAEARAGRHHITVPAGGPVVTPAAWSKARELGVTIDRIGAGPQPPPAVRAPSPPGTCTRTEDVSGVRVVHGQSVQLGRFDGAGPERHVGLVDVVTGRDGSPMTAGFMAWSRDDSFPWKLDYDEIDYVLDGVLQVTIGGHVVEARAGDVVYIPKGSDILFGTPHHVRVFYVTYPADWSGPAK